LGATGQPQKHIGIGPIAPGFVHVPYDDLEALDAACEENRVAAVILEAIQGEAGVVTPSPGYLEGARETCTRRGILLVVDEVQTGLGRTGRWFGFQSSGIKPDLVTIAKALGNGMPIGACWATAEVASAFGPGDHGTTFGGQPLAASAAAATLRVMQEIEAPGRAARAGRILQSRLAKIAGVDLVRGSGLLVGVQLSNPCAPQVVSEALRLGLVVNAPRPDTLRLAPPLIVTEDQIAEGVGIIANAVGAVVGAGGNGGSSR
jgi:acetylornithine/N-succinyldiaminopimelate aminotransferase